MRIGKIGGNLGEKRIFQGKNTVRNSLLTVGKPSPRLSKLTPLQIAVMMSKGGGNTKEVQKGIAELRQKYSEAKKVRRIHFEGTLAYIKESNTAMIDFLSTSVDTSKAYQKNKTLAYSPNLIFVLRILSFDILIASLPHSPRMQILSVLIVESSYLCFTVFTYWKIRNYKNILMFLAQVIQSCFVISLFVVFFIIHQKNITIEELLFGRVSPRSQNFGIHFIIFAILLEYLITALILMYNLGCFVVKKIKERKDKKNSKGKKEEEEVIEGFVYEMIDTKGEKGGGKVKSGSQRMKLKMRVSDGSEGQRRKEKLKKRRLNHIFGRNRRKSLWRERQKKKRAIESSKRD